MKVRWFLAAVFLSAACRNESGSSDTASAVPAYAGRIDLEIGNVMGDDPYLFTFVGGIAEDEAGRIYVADVQAHEVRVFDRDGLFVFSFGGEGEGPGELRRPCCLAWGPEGPLWIRETGNARYSSFQITEGDAQFETSMRTQHGAGNMFAPLGFDTEGRLVDVGMQTDPEGNSILVRLHVTSANIVDSTVAIADPPPNDVGLHQVTRDRSIFYFYQPFGPRHLVAHGPLGRWAEAISSSYEIELHASPGRAVTIHGPAGMGPRLSDAEREQASEQLASDRERGGLGLRDLPYGVPDRKPRLQQLLFDQEGRLWVERNVAGDQRVADVYDSTGGLVARYQWPHRVRIGVISWLGSTSLIGVTRDSLDVQRVARVRFVEVP